MPSYTIRVNQNVSLMFTVPFSDLAKSLNAVMEFVASVKTHRFQNTLLFCDNRGCSGIQNIFHNFIGECSKCFHGKKKAVDSLCIEFCHHTTPNPSNSST